MNIPLWKLDWPKLERPYCNIFAAVTENVELNEHVPDDVLPLLARNLRDLSQGGLTTKSRYASAFLLSPEICSGIDQHPSRALFI
jgi:hypothetical protein